MTDFPPIARSDLGSSVRFGYVYDGIMSPLLTIDSFRHRDGTTTWLLAWYPYDDAPQSFCTKHAAIDAAEALLVTKRLKGEI